MYKYYLTYFKIYNLLASATRFLVSNVPLIIRGMSIGRRTFLPLGKHLTWPHRIEFGKNCTVNAGFVCREYSSGDRLDRSVSVGDSAYIDHDVRIIVGTIDAKVIIGNNVFLGIGCQLSARESIKIGNDCQLAAGCFLVDFDHGTTIGVGPMQSQQCVDSPIVLEDDVWLGSGVKILKGVTIGTGAIVGSGAVVNKSIPPFEIWAGVPAKKIGRRYGAGGA